MLQEPKEKPRVAAHYGGEDVLPLAARGVYPKTRVWGSELENMHCFSATASLRVDLRWGCEESSEKTAVGSEGVSFKYDPFGRRIYKLSSSGTSVYAYDGDNLIEETNSTGAVVARYSQGLNIDEPLAMLRGGATSFYHADGLGSVTSLSSSAGSIANTYTYDPFGNLTASTGSITNPFRYTARESDTEAGLYYYRARYYDPTAGKFISEDPVSFGGGTNFYTYGLDSPVNLTDPLGLCPPEGCAPPNTHNPQPSSKCSIYPDRTHRWACDALAGDDTIGQCVRGCLLDQYDTQKHTYKCDEFKLHCLCFDACGYTSGLRARVARNHFDCDPPLKPGGGKK